MNDASKGPKYLPLKNGSHPETPFYDPRWKSKEGLVTRLGFENGCIETFAYPRAPDDIMTMLCMTDKEKAIYRVRRSDWSLFQDAPSSEPFSIWWEGTNLKTARKVYNAMKKGLGLDTALCSTCSTK